MGLLLKIFLQIFSLIFSKFMWGMQPCSPAVLQPSQLSLPKSKHCPMHLPLKYLCFSLNGRNQVSHLYKKNSQIYSIIIFLGIKWEDRGFWINWWHAFPRRNQILISSFDTRIKSLVYYAKYWNLKGID